MSIFVHTAGGSRRALSRNRHFQRFQFLAFLRKNQHNVHRSARAQARRAASPSVPAPNCVCGPRQSAPLARRHRRQKLLASHPLHHRRLHRQVSLRKVSAEENALQLYRSSSTQSTSHRSARSRPNANHLECGGLREASKFRRRASLVPSRAQPASNAKLRAERRRQVAALQKSPRQGIWSCKGGSATKQFEAWSFGKGGTSSPPQRRGHCGAFSRSRLVNSQASSKAVNPYPQRPKLHGASIVAAARAAWSR